MSPTPAAPPTAAANRTGRPLSVRVPHDVRLVGYSMRNMRQDYLDRLRLLSVYERTSIEAQVLRALGKGLAVLEAERRAKRAAATRRETTA